MNENYSGPLLDVGLFAWLCVCVWKIVVDDDDGILAM